MCERMAGKRGVIRLDVQFEVAGEPVVTQKTDNRLRVEVVLVLHRLHRFGFDQERPLEADGATVIAGFFQKDGHMLQFAARIGVVQTGITFPPAPENVVPAAEFDGCVKSGLDLRRRIGNNREIGIGRCAVHITRMREQIGGPPQQRDTGRVLALPGEFDHLAQIALGLAERTALKGEIEIVKAPERHVQLAEKLEGGVDAIERTMAGRAARRPGMNAGARTERVRAGGAKRVPVAHREAQVFLHGFAGNDPRRLVGFEGQRIV